MSGELALVDRVALAELLAPKRRTMVVSLDPFHGAVHRCSACAETWTTDLYGRGPESHNFDCPVTALLMPDPRPMALLESAIDKLASHEEQRHTEAREDLLELWKLLGGYER